MSRIVIKNDHIPRFWWELEDSDGFTIARMNRKVYRKSEAELAAREIQELGLDVKIHDKTET